MECSFLGDCCEDSWAVKGFCFFFSKSNQAGNNSGGFHFPFPKYTRRRPPCMHAGLSLSFKMCCFEIRLLHDVCVMTGVNAWLKKEFDIIWLKSYAFYWHFLFIYFNSILIWKNNEEAGICLLRENKLEITPGVSRSHFQASTWASFPSFSSNMFPFQIMMHEWVPGNSDYQTKWQVWKRERILCVQAFSFVYFHNSSVPAHPINKFSPNWFIPSLVKRSNPLVLLGATVHILTFYIHVHLLVS